MEYYIAALFIGFLIGSLKWRTWLRKLKIYYIRAVNRKAYDLTYGDMKDIFEDK